LDLQPDDVIIATSNAALDPEKELDKTDKLAGEGDAAGAGTWDELARRLRAASGQEFYYYVRDRQGKAWRRAANWDPFQLDAATLACPAAGQKGASTPSQLPPTPVDPRDPSGKRLDYFVFRDRMRELAGKPVVLEVEREAHKEHVRIFVPPAYHHTFGVRFEMGEVAALRNDSPAAKGGVQAKDQQAGEPGDILSKLV